MVSIPPKYIPITKVTIVDEKIKEEDLIEYCKKYGNVDRVRQMTSKNCFYVSYNTIEEASLAFTELKKIDGLRTSRP